MNNDAMQAALATWAARNLPGRLIQPRCGCAPHLLYPYALRAGFSIEEIFNLTKIDRWFLVQTKESVGFEEELGAKT